MSLLADLYALKRGFVYTAVAVYCLISREKWFTWLLFLGILGYSVIKAKGVLCQGKLGSAANIEYFLNSDN